MRYIGLDIGTNNTKGLLVDGQGRVLARQALAHDTDSPHPGWAEQDPDTQWWGQVVSVLQRLLKAAGEAQDEIGGICVSGLFPAVLIADRSGHPLRPAILYSDNRAAEELEQLNQRFGLTLDGDAVLPKLAWIRSHEPQSFAHIAYLFSAHNYIVYRLTGAYCLDYKVASALGGWLDGAQMDWRADLTQWIGLDPSRLPRLCSPAQVAGRLTDQAAQITGLPAGIPVLAGSGDSLLTLLGAGVVKRGEALLSFGTTGWLATLPQDLDQYLKNSKGSPYRLDAYLISLGSTLKWIGQNFKISTAGAPGEFLYQEWDGAACDIPPGCEGLIFLPYLQGTRLGSQLEPGGGSICGFDPSHTGLHIYRALLESFGYVVRSALDDLDKEGIHPSQLVCSGSGAKSKLWTQIVSDITGKPCVVYSELDPCLGNAFLAAYAAGESSSLGAIAGWLPSARITYPKPETQVAYDGAYQRFAALRSTLSK